MYPLLNRLTKTLLVLTALALAVPTTAIAADLDDPATVLLSADPPERVKEQKEERKREKERRKAERKWEKEQRKEARERDEYDDRYDRDRDDWDRDDRYDDDDRDDWDDRYDDDRDVPSFCRTGEGHPVFGMDWCRGERSGPAFCRTGAGHPEYGMRWCYEQGYGAGPDHWRTYDDRYDDIVFDRRPEQRGDRYPVERRVLDDILGDRTYRRLDDHRARLGFDGPLDARWREFEHRPGAQVLEVMVGNVPFAEFIDTDGDGRVDLALVLDP